VEHRRVGARGGAAWKLGLGPRGEEDAAWKLGFLYQMSPSPPGTTGNSNGSGGEEALTCSPDFRGRRNILD
jgi:hypothetical protein